MIKASLAKKCNNYHHFTEVRRFHKIFERHFKVRVNHYDISSTFLWHFHPKWNSCKSLDVNHWVSYTPEDLLCSLLIDGGVRILVIISLAEEVNLLETYFPFSLQGQEHGADFRDCLKLLNLFQKHFLIPWLQNTVEETLVSKHSGF